MCGLAGFISASGQPAEALMAGVGAMRNALLHRGPDDSGVWVDAEAGVALGHQRLSIFDLSPAGHQPMLSACGRYVIVFNGEIYNHLFLRKQLAIGLEHEIKWHGHSDTETLLACIASWGVERALRQAVGMFSIALWDRYERKLFLARDRLGEKPLYYGWTKDVFLFGSELKALKKYPGFDNSIDRDALALYFQRNYIPAPYSIYQGVYKLEPGCLMTLELDSANAFLPNPPRAPFQQAGLSVTRWWSLKQRPGLG